MLEDKQRWNEKYKTMAQSEKASSVLQRHLEMINVGRALDIACGKGRNSYLLADYGFLVDAVDYSDYALAQIRDIESINKIDTDLDMYEIPLDSYDLIVNINYLDRRFFTQIKEGLKQNGVIVFETFVMTEDEHHTQLKNVKYLLRENELLDAFRDLHILYYEERDEVNKDGEKIRIASLVARKV